MWLVKHLLGSYPEVLNLKKFYRQVEEMNTLNERFGRSKHSAPEAVVEKPHTQGWSGVGCDGGGA